MTGSAFAQASSFGKQLACGVPYWRAKLDPATGIDLYGSNGISVGDIDGDGIDEIYVCQPGGLPNRLYKFTPDGTLTDITDQWNAGILDDTSSALFLDLRNIGRQDLVVLRANGPVLLLNEGEPLLGLRDRRAFASPTRSRQAPSPAWQPPTTTATANSTCISAATSISKAKPNTLTLRPTTTRRTGRPISSFATASTPTAAVLSKTSPPKPA